MVKQFLNSLTPQEYGQESLRIRMKACEWRLQTKSLTAARSLKKTKKEPRLVVGELYCTFILLLYRCNEIVLVSITI